MDLNFANGVEYFMDALPVIGTGYLGIFIVTAVIIAVSKSSWLVKQA